MKKYEGKGIKEFARSDKENLFLSEYGKEIEKKNMKTNARDKKAEKKMKFFDLPHKIYAS